MNIKISSRGKQKMNPCKVVAHRIDSRTVRGMTLPELMVATAVGSLILMVMATLFISSARGFAAIGSYVNMDAASRNALDHMTLEIRQTGSLTQFSPKHLTFTAPGQTNSFLVYNWDSTARQLTEWKTGNATTNILLTGCEQLTFSLYNAAFAPTTNLSAMKGLSVKWKCSRTILGLQSTTEDMQQALIVIRNKPGS